jgi:hypothetical protein
MLYNVHMNLDQTEQAVLETLEHLEPELIAELIYKLSGCTPAQVLDAITDFVLHTS